VAVHPTESAGSIRDAQASMYHREQKKSSKTKTWIALIFPAALADPSVCDSVCSDVVAHSRTCYSLQVHLPAERARDHHLHNHSTEFRGPCCKPSDAHGVEPTIGAVCGGCVVQCVERTHPAWAVGPREGG
jgi:hypothetical protein